MIQKPHRMPDFGDHSPPVSVPIPIAYVASEVPVMIRDIDWQRFLYAEKNVRFELRLVSPAWAAHVLDNFNTRNRNLTGGYVKIHESIMEERWFPNGECVVFDIDGVLINGQHRLKAIVTSKFTVPVFVVYGIDPAAMGTFDQTKKRNAAHVLQMNKHICTHTLAAALGWQKLYDDGMITATTGRAIPPDLILEELDKHMDMVESIKRISMRRCKLIPPSLATFLHYQFAKRDEELANHWLHSTMTGENVTTGSPLALLRRRLEGMTGSKVVEVHVEIAALCIKAWNLMRSGGGAGRQVIVWRIDEKFPEIN